MSVAEEAIEADRRLRPKLWRKADAVARIIDPEAFAQWYDTTDPDAEPVDPTTRVKAKRATARRKAWEVLMHLGIAPETTDWTAIFKEMEAADG